MTDRLTLADVITPNSEKPTPSKGRLPRNLMDRQSNDLQHMHSISK